MDGRRHVARGENGSFTGLQTTARVRFILLSTTQECHVERHKQQRLVGGVRPSLGVEQADEAAGSHVAVFRHVAEHKLRVSTNGARGCNLSCARRGGDTKLKRRA